MSGSFESGTCYTANECERRSGRPSLSCASGLGVCCVCELERKYIVRKFLFFNNMNDTSFSVNKGCGETSAENSTHFRSRGDQPAGACTLKICRNHDRIVQVAEYKYYHKNNQMHELRVSLLSSGWTSTILGCLDPPPAQQCLTLS